jgi:hypothetical protein
MGVSPSHSRNGCIKKTQTPAESGENVSAKVAKIDEREAICYVPRNDAPRARPLALRTP